ncbi:transporter substrate-binding domain-containing protein [Falsochrobactrum sp. TDYN1]|uniref:Transporter substrate-binding domain-containing protein n=1 Tax=Falsochrobactrum tianjinense TaxID=2706015 RepID=A0A949UT61_9HYPH|nr:transporter substrate-binding domain-containing protein [Falsochrobactrum sp. TDYN1]MBV2143475.1 transporter substrate-binding domain-containing protein [Falsochrobactrum sp. TDYN1]
MKLVTLTAAALAIFTGVMSSATAEPRKSLTLGTEGAYKPWGYMENGTTLVGFEIDMMRELCKRMGVECEIVTNDFAGLIPALTAGKFDAIFAGMNSTEKRRKTIAFSRAYALDPASFGLPKDAPLSKLPQAGQEIDLKADKAQVSGIIEAMKPMLEGQIIGVQGSTTLSQFLEENFSDTVTIREYNTTEQHDLDLAAGRIDGILALGSALRTAWSKPELAEKYQTTGPKFFGDVLGDGIAVGMRREDTALKTKFDNAINSMIKDGSLKELSVKWFGVDMTPGK